MYYYFYYLTYSDFFLMSQNFDNGRAALSQSTRRLNESNENNSHANTTQVYLRKKYFYNDLQILIE